MKKTRALALNQGNFSVASLNLAFKTTLITARHHPSSKELVRSNIITKSTIVEIDAEPLRMLRDRLIKKNPNAVIDSRITQQLEAGNRVLACISSRPGQCGRADGIVLEGKMYDFYVKKMSKRSN